jgi:hypothetical protein
MAEPQMRLNELEPRWLPLSPEARVLWVGFADHVEASVGSGGDMEAIRGLANKLPEHAARLAAVLALPREHFGLSTLALPQPPAPRKVRCTAMMRRSGTQATAATMQSNTRPVPVCRAAGR